MSYINNSHTKFISLPNGNYKIEIERGKNWNEIAQEVLDERKELLDRLKKNIRWEEFSQWKLT